MKTFQNRQEWICRYQTCLTRDTKWLILNIKYYLLGLNTKTLHNIIKPHEEIMLVKLILLVSIKKQ